MAAPERFHMRATASPETSDRTLFEQVRAGIGNAAAYVAHEVMPDIRSKLIDEAWFGRGQTYGHSHPSAATGDFWRGSKTITIEGEWSREAPRPDTPDLSHER